MIKFLWSNARGLIIGYSLSVIGRGAFSQYTNPTIFPLNFSPLSIHSCKQVFFIDKKFHMIAYIIESMRGFFQSWYHHMLPIYIVVIVGVFIQVVKVVIDRIRYRRFYIGHIFDSWGFPSFHSGLASSVTMLVWLTQGFSSLGFAVAFAFSLLFAYDAMNLRYEAGQHAQYINSMRFELQNVLQKKEWPLKERIWHTPFEVAGGIIVGSVLTFMLYYRFFLV